jgi:hypothetical protein
MKRERIQKNNKVNDITCKKFADVFQSLQKKNLIMQISKENGKSKHPCLNM